MFVTMSKPQWRESLTFTRAFRFLMLLRSKTRSTNLHLKQFSVLDLCWPPILALPATLSLKVRTAPVPNNLKQSIIEYMVPTTIPLLPTASLHCEGTAFLVSSPGPATAIVLLRSPSLGTLLPACWRWSAPLGELKKPRHLKWR